MNRFVVKSAYSKALLFVIGKKLYKFKIIKRTRYQPTVQSKYKATFDSEKV